MNALLHISDNKLGDVMLGAGLAGRWQLAWEQNLSCHPIEQTGSCGTSDFGRDKAGGESRALLLGSHPAYP